MIILLRRVSLRHHGSSLVRRRAPATVRNGAGVFDRVTAGTDGSGGHRKSTLQVSPRSAISASAPRWSDRIPVFVIRTLNWSGRLLQTDRISGSGSSVPFRPVGSEVRLLPQPFGKPSPCSLSVMRQLPWPSEILHWEFPFRITWQRRGLSPRLSSFASLGSIAPIWPISSIMRHVESAVKGIPC